MNKTRQNLFIISILSLGLVLPSLGNTFSSKEEKSDEIGAVAISDKYEKGPMFYPASYSTNFTDEPRYNSYQKSLTFNYLNMGDVSNHYRGDNVKVAVIDSGINYTHEDFQLNGDTVVKGESRSIEYTTVGGVTKWYYFNFSDSPTRLNDTLFHGTAVASTIASVLNGVGGAGLAPNVELYVYKVTNSADGYEWTAINNALQYCIDEGIDVINMSFQAYVNTVSYGGYTQTGSGTSLPTTLSTKINACHNAGITMVAAAGNYNTTEPSYPAHNDHVISVGSLAKNSITSKAGFSNYGVGNVDLVAPGYVNVANIGGNSEYLETQGTSFSAPLVTAAIALYKQKYPTATPDEIEAALLASCDEITGQSSWAGAGKLNVANFLNEEAYEETGVTLDRNTATIDIGTTTKTVQLTATVQNGEYFPDVTWSSSSSSVASVSSSGLVTGKAVGTATITAETKHGYKAYCTVTVTESAVLPTSITLNHSTQIELEVGDTFNLDWTVNPSNATDKSVSFNNYDDEVVSIDSNGVITALAEGESLVEIYSNADSSVRSSLIEVSVSEATPTPAPRYGTYTLLNDVSKLTVGSRVIFASATSSGKGMSLTQNTNNRGCATITYSSSNIVVGASSNTSLATFIVESGTATNSFAFRDDGTTTGYLYAASSSDNQLKTQASINANASFTISLSNTNQATVTAQGTNSRKLIKWNNSSSIFSCYASGQSNPYIYYQPNPIYPTSTTISGDTTANTGDDVQLSISYSPSSTTVKNTTWSSSSNTLATVTATGLVHTLKAGTVTITATSDAANSTTITSTHTIVISDVAVSGVTLNTNELELYTGGSSQLVATITPNNATNKGVTWTSGDTSIATVTNTGLVTAVSPGETSIEVTTVDGGHTAFCGVIVTNKLVTSITLSENSRTIEIGSSFNLTATVAPNDASNKNVSWTNSNSSYASMTTNGASATITGVAIGTTTITVTAQDGSGVNATCTVTVVDKVVLTSITVTGYNTTVPYMDTYSLGSYTCTAHYSDPTHDKTVTPTSITNNIDTSVLGTQYVIFSYTDDGTTKTFEAPVKVTNVGAEGNIGYTKPDVEVDKSVTYSFTDKSWATSENAFTSGKDGNGFMNSGVQVTKGTTGANATSKATYSNIQSVVVSYCTNGSSGTGSIKIKIGSNTEVSQDVTKVGGTSARNLSFTGTNITDKTGTVKITVTCTDNSIYVCGIIINYKEVTPGEDYPATPEEQALAWAKYFKSVTGPYCSAKTGSTMEGDVWNDLKSEYEAMTDDSKDAFFESSDADVVDARARYAILIANYSNLTNFILDSNDNKLVNKNNNPIIGFINESTNWLVIILSISVVGVVGAFLLIKCRKHD